jgi:DNA transformation protein and related proteins
MPLSCEYLDFLIEQLAPLGRLTVRRMFGGAGLYCDGLFFGLIWHDTLYLRADERNRADYTTRGMQPFRPRAGRRQGSVHYYAAPAEVLEDTATLCGWARYSLAAALAAQPRAGAPTGAARPARARRRRPAAV